MTQETLWVSIMVACIWAAVAVTSIFAPDLVAGDSSRIPVAAVISPICGAIATKYVVGWGKRN